MFRDRLNWRVRWTEAGKSRSKTFANKKDAALFEAQLKCGTISVSTKEVEQLTFKKWADKWFEIYAKVKKSESTWATDKSELRNHILPLIGHQRLSEIKKSHGLDLKAVCIGKGLREKSVNNILHLAKKNSPGCRRLRPDSRYTVAKCQKPQGAKARLQILD